MLDPTLAPFFSPQGVAIVGASHDPTKLGYGLSRNLVQSDYRGAIHFVNIHGSELLGHPVYPSLAEVPDPVDLAVLLIPAAATPQALEACARRGIRSVILAAGGFRETSLQGAALEAQCLQIARQHGIRLIGPNCIGLLDTHLPIDVTFLSPPGPTPGDIAFISHSGAICAAVIDWARGQGFGLSRLVSLGNQADICESDVLAAVADDPYTRVLTLYLEGVGDGRRFVEQASLVSRIKPILALKVGRYASGRKAVASHTGALAGQESAFNAAFRRAGVIRADTSEELFDWARALAWCPLPRGRSVAVLTNSGGPGVTAADALEAQGLVLAALSEDTRAALGEFLDPSASLHNPVDMLAGASPQQFANSLRLLLADPGVDSALVILPPPPMHTAGGIAKAIIPVIFTADKPVVIALMGERLIQEAVEYFRAARIPDYRFPERAVAALAILSQRAEALQRTTSQEPAAPDPTGTEPAVVRAALSNYPPSALQLSAGFLPPDAAAEILRSYGLPVPLTPLAADADEAVRYAAELGYPVVLKVASPDIPHKSDVDGVRLDLKNAAAVRRAFKQVTANASRAAPAARLLGAHLQRMQTAGQDVIIGTVQDPQFGPLLMFGSGGVEVEGLKDVEFCLAPPTPEELERLLEKTWAGRRLKGYRQIPPADLEAVRFSLLRLAQLAVDFPGLAEIEINPLRVFRDGASALDYRIRVAS
ncbi:MAG TPA: acetate--CoA ligase family protein [Anaerolineales bacterium]|nr:acetate--CoA ligase family protein [Anaerolineales bacterium]